MKQKFKEGKSVVSSEIDHSKPSSKFVKVNDISSLSPYACHSFLSFPI